jgi:hypothetical protein
MGENTTATRLAIVEAQLAAAVGILACLIETIPQQQVPALRERLHRMLETTHAGLLAGDDADSETRLEALATFRRVLFADARLAE